MDQIQPERKPINAIIINLFQALSDGTTEISMDELTYMNFMQTQDKYFEVLKYIKGVLMQEAPQKYKDLIFKCDEVLPEFVRDA